MTEYEYLQSLDIERKQLYQAAQKFCSTLPDFKLYKSKEDLLIGSFPCNVDRKIMIATYTSYKPGYEGFEQVYREIQRRLLTTNERDK